MFPTSGLVKSGFDFPIEAAITQYSDLEITVWHGPAGEYLLLPAIHSDAAIREGRCRPKSRFGRPDMRQALVRKVPQQCNRHFRLGMTAKQTPVFGGPYLLLGHGARVWFMGAHRNIIRDNCEAARDQLDVANGTNGFEHPRKPGFLTVKVRPRDTQECCDLKVLMASLVFGQPPSDIHRLPKIDLAVGGLPDVKPAPIIGPAKHIRLPGLCHGKRDRKAMIQGKATEPFGV